MKKIVFILIIIGIFYVNPSLTSAYFTTDQTVTALSDHAAMFTITYKFGLKNGDLYMPIFGTRDLEHNANTGAIGFEILHNSKEISPIGTAAGIALSNASIKNGMYFVPEGTSASFTFVTFLSLSEDDDHVDAALHIQELPFYVGDKKEHRKLNPSELQYYITPEIDLNETK